MPPSEPRRKKPGRSRFDEELDALEEEERPLWGKLEEELDRLERDQLPRDFP